MTDSDAPKVRHSVRVLLVNESKQLLLFRGVEPDTGRPFWFPAGGGLEADEDVEAAARREVAEETGLMSFELGPEVWHRRHVFEWRGVNWDQHERWFLARVAAFELDGSGQTEEERTELTEARWWSLDELQATEDNLVPRDLATLLQDLLENGPPREPVQVGR
jgi:8-oxo-dGTP pyrophosphatase MutT (NUDIX family)